MSRTRSALQLANLLALAFALLACGTADDDAPAPATDTPRAVIVEPADGAELDGATVRVLLRAEHITLAPAGDTAPGTAHLHLFINTEPTMPGQPIPAGVDGIVHLGQAQTAHELTALAPGDYTLIAVLGDLVHRRLDPQVTDTVRIRVRQP